MPQMAPYNWLILFMLFNMIMIFIISNNHFICSKKLNKIDLIFLPVHYNWKW